MKMKQIKTKIKNFLAKVVVKFKNRITSAFKQEELVQEAYEGILLTKFNAIKDQLMKTDKTFLVGLILSEKITDDNDIHFYYQSLQKYKAEFLKHGV